MERSSPTLTLAKIKAQIPEVLEVNHQTPTTNPVPDHSLQAKTSLAATPHSLANQELEDRILMTTKTTETKMKRTLRRDQQLMPQVTLTILRRKVNKLKMLILKKDFTGLTTKRELTLLLLLEMLDLDWTPLFYVANNNLFEWVR
jgi:hypothetical protein